MADTTTDLAARVPAETLEWLTAPDNPAVAVLTRRQLLDEPASAELDALWARRNEYEPVATILKAMLEDGSWAPPARDYKKYTGSLWQIHFLGELYADGDDPRIEQAAAYAFSRQLPDGSWSCNGRPVSAIPCLTANVGRALARLGFASDERVISALRWISDLYAESGVLGCRQIAEFTLNGYCHMVAPKLLLFLAEVPRDAWPSGATLLRDACIEALRDKQIYRSLPAESREYEPMIVKTPASERGAARERFFAENPELHYGDKPGWLRLGYPLSYNSDALEALFALAEVGEPRRTEYEAAIEVVRDAADSQMRWTLRNSFNGKMLANVEAKGRPSRWLTLRSLLALQHFGV